MALGVEEQWVTLEVGEKAPDFEAELTDGSTIRLSEVLSRRTEGHPLFLPKGFDTGMHHAGL